MVEVTVEYIRETENAILVSDGDVEVWLPKSQIEYEEPSDSYVLEVELPEWLAIEKELV